MRAGGSAARRIDAPFDLGETLPAAQRIEARVEAHPAEQDSMLAGRSRQRLAGSI
jgi:hypothetical protein